MVKVFTNLPKCEAAVHRYYIKMLFWSVSQSSQENICTGFLFNKDVSFSLQLFCEKGLLNKCFQLYLSNISEYLFCNTPPRDYSANSVLFVASVSASKDSYYKLSYFLITLKYFRGKNCGSLANKWFWKS